MQEQEQTTAVAVREAHPGALVMSDDELRRSFRVAEALYMSGAWQLKNAEAALAKIIVGRDLGLSPAQAMQGIHIVEGGVQMHYAQIGQFVRAREGYDYRAGWLKQEAVLDVGQADPKTGEVRPTPPPPIVAVYHAEEEPTDVRPIVGAFVEFYVDGERRGVSRFTIEDAEAAGLIKRDKPKAAWNTSRRNMFLARAMSNGAKWFVPEVFGGMPVYSMGEIPASEQKSITAPAGDGDDTGSGVDLGPEVEAIIERATRLGHRGLSNRAAVELAVGKRAPGLVKDWRKRAKEELDRFEGGKLQQQPGNAEPVAEREVEEPEQEVTGEVVVPTPEPSTTSPPTDAVVSTGGEDPEVVLLRDRYRRLKELEEDATGEDLDQLHAELDVVEGKLRAKGVDPEPGQIDANSDGEEQA